MLNQFLLLKKTLFELDPSFEEDFYFFQKDRLCSDSDSFFRIYTFVVCNSGMRAQIALTIFKKILLAIYKNQDISLVFNHKHKVDSIKYVFNNKEDLFSTFVNLEKNKIDKILEFCESLPHIGPITKYHLAKDLGCDVIKPDRHLVRIAKVNGFSSPEEMCLKIKEETGFNLAAIDYIFWRAANLKLI